jgi:hypothetical protein
VPLPAHRSTRHQKEEEELEKMKQRNANKRILMCVGAVVGNGTKSCRHSLNSARRSLMSSMQKRRTRLASISSPLVSPSSKTLASFLIHDLLFIFRQEIGENDINFILPHWPDIRSFFVDS